MRITLNIDNTVITLENENKTELMNIFNKLMNNATGSFTPSIRQEFKETIAASLPPQQPAYVPVRQNSYVPDRAPSYAVKNRPFIACSDKQKQLLKNIPEYKGVDLNSISKSEASMAIEKWNKSRAYHYKDHY